MASEYIPLVSWETKIDTPLPVIGEPYYYTCKVVSINPNDYSPGTLGINQFYIVDYLGKIYEIVEIIDLPTGEVKIYDLIESAYEGPYVDQNAFVYQSRQYKNTLTQAQRKRLHPSAFDMIWNIENNVLNFLNDLSDINLSGESKFDVLMYNESSWENSSYYYDLHNRIDGAFRLYGGVITENVDGTVDVTAGKGMVHTLDGVIEGAAVDANSHWISPMIEVEWDAVSGLTLTDHAYNYIYYDYETGTIKTTTDFYSISFHREFTVGRVYRTGNDVVARICGTNAWAFDKRVQLFGEERFPVERAKGMMIGNPSGLYISVTEGVLWAELVNRFSVDAFDSSGTDIFTYWYRDGSGGFTSVASQTQIDNVYWDDNTGTLNDLTANRYGVHWVYEVHNSTIHIVYGRGDYTLTQAQETTPPTDIPGLLDAYSILIGKIIVQKNSVALYSVESPFVDRFTVSGVTSHLDLTDIGTNTHAQIDSHIGDATIHFTNPLTTKGDLWTYSSVNARLPVGTNGQVLSADSAETTGLKWIDAPTGGVSTFIALTDTPGSYTANKWLKVNSGATALEFTDPPTGTISIGTQYQIPYVNSGGTDFDYSSNFKWNTVGLTLNDSNANTLIGSSGSNITTASVNASIGYFALNALTEGQSNVGIGTYSMLLTTTGSFNTAIGYDVLRSNISGEGNVAIGLSAGYNCLGSDNIFIGRSAGYDETGSNKLYIDNQARSGVDAEEALIYGEFNATIASQLLRINGVLDHSLVPNKPKIYTQATEPDIPSNTMAFWKDSDDSKYYLILDIGGTQKKVELI